jgi:hypothetical protein
MTFLLEYFKGIIQITLQKEIRIFDCEEKEFLEVINNNNLLKNC